MNVMPDFMPGIHVFWIWAIVEDVDGMRNSGLPELRKFNRSRKSGIPDLR
jgi:hypothetical protein